ncbi:MAG TPA: hypothetical protein VEI97_12035 [bacterium]|nr:hypothetical protein [bacterium]
MRNTIPLILGITLGLTPVVGCAPDNDRDVEGDRVTIEVERDDNDSEEAAESIRDAANEVEETARQAGNNIEESVQDAANDIEDRVDDDN